MEGSNQRGSCQMHMPGEEYALADICLDGN